MKITEVRIKFANREADRLKAYCSVTFDEEFVIRDVRIVEGTNGLFVAMPSRKLSTSCPRCSHKNPSMARFCNECGARLPAPAEGGAKTKLHRDIAHPITTTFRQLLHKRIIEAYEQELERAGEPDYAPHPIEPDENEENEFEVEEEQEQEQEQEQEVYAKAEQDSDEVSEYDALIAGLRKRTAEAPIPRASVQPSQRTVRPSVPQQRRPAGKPRQPEPTNPRQKGNRPLPPVETPRPVGREEARPRATVRAAQAPAERSAVAEREPGGFSRHETRREEPEQRPAATPPKAETGASASRVPAAPNVASVNDGAEADPFGAGIL